MTNPELPIKGIIVGCGFMGGMHAQIYKQLEGVELIAAVDASTGPSSKKLEALGLSIPIFATLEEALGTTECDFVDLCVPTNSHLEFALQVISAGKALFCEKPLALTLAEADEIISAAKAKGTLAQVGHCIRFWPEYKALLDFHKSGQGGRLLSLSLVRRSGRPGYGVENWLNNPARSGGAALDLHIHDTDFVLAMLGQPSSVTSRVTEDYSGPSHIFTLFGYDGMTVSAEGGWNYPPNWGFEMAFQALYENAILDYSSSNGKGLLICAGDEAPKPMEVSKPGAGDSVSGEGNISDLGGYYNELLYFTQCLRDNKPPEIATLEDARASLALALQEIQSANAR